MNCPHCGKSIDETEPVESDQMRWFNAFWALYPRKVAKASALKAWKKAATSEAIKDEIMAGLRNSLRVWGILDPLTMKYIPHAATWLHGRRWEDEAQSPAKIPDRVIACDKCGDSGIVEQGKIYGTVIFGRCSCPRGQLPGLLIPDQAQDSF